MIALIMQAMCCRQNPRRINHHPNEIKTVLIAFMVALNVGRSVMVIAVWSDGMRER
jgi:hypothetical protein